MINQQDITALILAGGQGSRMGGLDKGLLAWQGRPFIEYVISALKPQVAAIMINANRNLEHYQQYGLTVVSDGLSGYQGPLAGIAAALPLVKTPYLLTLPCDSPYVANDLVARMLAALNTSQAELAVAHDGIQAQPTYALIPTDLLLNLKHFLDSGERKVRAWQAQHRVAMVDCRAIAQMFENINTPAQYQALQESGL
jgi:molybdenum cofactor guanylyltransferase